MVIWSNKVLEQYVATEKKSLNAYQEKKVHYIKSGNQRVNKTVYRKHLKLYNFEPIIQIHTKCKRNNPKCYYSG